MKNVLLKIGIAAIAAFVFIGGSLFVKAQNATPTPIIDPTVQTTDPVNYGFGMGRGMMNEGWGMRNNWDGERDMRGLENFLPGFAMAFAGLGLVFGILAILLLIFWIWMLVHAVKSDIEYKPVWILVLWFLNIIGAIVYYFAVKKEYDRWAKEYENVCVCEDGVCTCGKVKKQDVNDIKEDLN